MNINCNYLTIICNYMNINCNHMNINQLSTIYGALLSLMILIYLYQFFKIITQTKTLRKYVAKSSYPEMYPQIFSSVGVVSEFTQSAGKSSKKLITK